MRYVGRWGRGLRGAVSALVASWVWGAASESRAQSPMFLLDSEIDISTFVYAANQTTGQLTLLGPLDIMLGEATGLAADGPDVLYVATLLGNIIQIDLAPSYSATTLGNVGGKLTQMQLHNGLLYVVAEDTDELATVQISPLLKTVIGPITVGAMGPTLDIVGGDLTIDSAGNWYLFTNGTQKLYSLDVTTAVATEIGPAMWTSGRITGLAVDYGDGDKLYASARDLDQLLTLDPTTGDVIGSINVCVSCPTTFDLRAGDLGVPQPTQTPTASATHTATQTGTATHSATVTATATHTATVTATATHSATRTATLTRTVTATGTITSTPTNTPLRDDGEPCTDPAQCQSMICVDDVCCNEPCDGDNESCDVPGREGECLPLTTAPAPALSFGMMLAALASLIGIAAIAIRLRRTV